MSTATRLVWAALPPAALSNDKKDSEVKRKVKLEQLVEGVVAKDASRQTLRRRCWQDDFMAR